MAAGILEGDEGREGFWFQANIELRDDLRARRRIFFAKFGRRSVGHRHRWGFHFGDEFGVGSFALGILEIGCESKLVVGRERGSSVGTKTPLR